MCNEPYAIEQRACGLGFSYAQRGALRAELFRPVMNRLYEFLRTNRP
jgi:hypothetical protein